MNDREEIPFLMEVKNFSFKPSPYIANVRGGGHEREISNAGR
jgi:hypothetical protein